MTIRIASFVLLLTLAFDAYAQTPEKTFTKAYNPNGKTRISFDLPGPIDLKVWGNATIRIEITVHLPSGNLSMLDQLASVGRYDLKAESTDESLDISAPNLQKLVRIKGETIREEVSYVVYVPKDLEVKLHGPLALAAGKK